MPRHLEPKRLVHYAEGCFSLRNAKMSVGVIRYSADTHAAVIDSSQAGKTSDEVLGFGPAIPIVGSLDEAMAFEPNAMLAGITPPGGRITPELRRAILAAIEQGLDVLNGMHDFLGDDAEFREAAARRGTALWDIRKPAPNLPIGNARCRGLKNYIALTVGSDAAIGKMTAALEIDRVAKARGARSEFVATGQTGIAIAGWGSPVDAIAGDFMAGAVEKDTMEAAGRADIVLVEGQGSLLHPGFSSVTLALLHGCCPDGLVLCHQSTRREISKLAERIPIPPLDQVAQLYIDQAKHIKPTELVAISINTSGTTEAEARAELAAAEALCGVPATDPIRFGAEKLYEAIAAHRARIGK